ncbi:MAG: NAD(P)-binding domain-containing protein [Methanosarcinaceae archaeon]|nr:NAD(P)-binding domain-containing protein [Methanosarcinaceae archaeon]
MKIAILGGTGNIGKGFALRLSYKHDVTIGSRNIEKAKASAAEYNEILEKYGSNDGIEGTDNKTAAQNADIIFLAIRYKNIPSIIELITPILDKQIIVSVVVPIGRDRCYINPDSSTLIIDVSDKDYNANYFCYSTPKAGSAAQEIAMLLPEGIELVSAFHNVPAHTLADLDKELDYDIGVCGNSTYSKNIVFELVRDIPNLRPLDVGPIETSSMVESLTPLLINIASRNKLKDLGIKFV